ncbi:MAG: DUF2290 domain-containing protein [Burkholderiales bacterium]|nr:DUF2290 domain-containing protein [Burkholderiales bacterium]
MTLSADKIRKQVEILTADLIRLSLCNHQNFPSVTSGAGGFKDISFSKAGDLSMVLKNQPYREIYTELDRAQAYNLKMIDGALIQMMYRFKGNALKGHRLAFFPSPYLEEFQNNPDIYESDEIFADIMMRNIVVFPLRFDFDSSSEIFVDQHHPKSHLTLGQYINCRIPVSSPVTPFAFLDFILRSFYNTAHRKYSSEINKFVDVFSNTITDSEKKIVHVQIPS